MMKAYFVDVREKGGTIEDLTHAELPDGPCVLLIAYPDEDLDWFIEGCKCPKLLGL